VGATMNRVWRCVACLFNELFRLDHFHDLGVLRVRFRVEDVNPRRSDARYDQVTTFHVRVRVLGAEARAACVPAEVMQLVIVVGEIYLANELAIYGGTRIDIDNAYGVALTILADVEQRDVGDAFRLGLHPHAPWSIKGCMLRQGHSQILLLQELLRSILPGNSSRNVTRSRWPTKPPRQDSRSYGKRRYDNAFQESAIPPAAEGHARRFGRCKHNSSAYYWATPLADRGVDSPEDDSALRDRHNTQPFTISLVSLDSRVEPTLPDRQSARRAAKPCCRIWVSLAVSRERAWVGSFSRTR